MANINRTVLGTSDPIDLCKGFALFPLTRQGERALQLGFHISKTLLAVKPQVLAWRFSADAGYTFSAGVCGPAFALRFEAQGQTTGNQIQLNITNDETAAGFLFGLQLEIFLNFSIENLGIAWISDGWNSRFEKQWNTILSIRPTVILDLIELVRDLLLKLFGSRNQTNTKLEKSPTPLRERVKSWGMFDYRKGQFAENDGILEASPSYSLPVNLVPLTKSIPPPGNLLFLADAALQGLWGGLEMGPRFTVGIPVRVELLGITVNNQHYENLTFDGNQVTGTGGQEIPNPRSLSVSLRERPGFEIKFDFFINVSVCKLFSLEASGPIANVTNWLGIKVAAGPFAETLSSPIGGGPPMAAADFRFEEDRIVAPAPIEVVFEPVEVVR